MRGTFERADEIFQRRVFIGVGFEIVPESVSKRAIAEIVMQLLQRGGAFPVGDSIKVSKRGIRIGDGAVDRVGGHQLVLQICRSLRPRLKIDPQALEFGRRSSGEERHVGSKALIQPKGVPPFHGDKIAEPHVRHFMQGHLGEALAVALRDRAAMKEVLGERDRRDVFHGAGVKLGNDDFIVFFERVWVREILAVKLQALLYRLYPVIDPDEFFKRLTCEKTDGNGPCFRVPLNKRTGVQGKQITADARSFRECPNLVFTLGFLVRFLARADNLPGFRSGDRQAHRRFHVRLVKARKHLVGVESFKLSIKINISIFRIFKAMQPAAFMRIVLLVGNFHDVAVVRFQFGNRQPDPVIGKICRQSLFVHGELFDARAVF